MLTSLFAGILSLALATPQDQAPTVLRLWSGDAPLALGKAEKDVPTLSVHRAPKPNGTAMILCPGGGYGMLATDHEGTNFSRYFTKFGITCFVLKYRLGTDGYRHPAMLFDAARAMRTVRARSKEWGIDPQKIGILGCSAGGHLASTLLTHFDSGKPDDPDPVERVASRPNFGVLCYAVVSMGIQTHGGSKRNLLGENPSAELIRELSNELQVKSDTPPCFIWHTMEDSGVPLENSVVFAIALREKKIPFELHIYEKGEHGLGLDGDADAPNLHLWTKELVQWLRVRGFASP